MPRRGRAMSEAQAARPSFLATLLDFKGRITAKQYWATVGIGFAFVVAAMLFAGMAMDPRGGSGIVFLAIPLFGMVVWLLAAAMAKRLRDVGKPPWAALVFMISLIGWLGLGVELIEMAWWLLPLGMLALFAMVGHIDRIIPKGKPLPHDAS